MKKYVIPVIALIALVTIISFRANPKLSVDGAWTIAEVQTIKANGDRTSVFPKESQVLFTGNNYSFAWTSHTTTQRSWQMTDSARLSRLNQTIVNDGTFELVDSILYTKAVFAMNPMFVDGLAKFKCSFNGDTLILTGVSLASSENILHPVYAGGSHIVNKLVSAKRPK